ncbi:MAG: Ig-like domain-containing protein [Gammaproteobacteria bacterium]
MTVRFWIALLALSVLSACGGGSDRSSAPPAPTAQPTVPSAVSTNLAPVAVNDFASVSDESVSIGVLANDSDADGDSLSILFTGRPSHGTVEIEDNDTPSFSGDDTLLYTPSAGYIGTDIFSYTVSDGRDGRANGYVTVVVGSSSSGQATANQTPVAKSDAVTTLATEAITVDVLANDTDGDAQPLSLFSFSAASNGIVSLDDNGTVATDDDKLVYVPDPGFVGTDTLTYSVTDGIDVSTATVRVVVSLPGDTPTPDGQVCGVVTLGPVNGAVVTLFAMDGRGQASGLPIAQTLTDPGGRWCVILPGNRADLLVVSRGGVFPDPSDSRYETGSARLIQIADFFELQTVLPQEDDFAALTVFSNAVLRKSRIEIEGDNFVAVFSRNREQAVNAFGFDVFTTDVADPVLPDASATLESQRYAMAVGAAATSLNQIAVDLSVAAPNYLLIDALVSDLSECRLNGRDVNGAVSVSVGGMTRTISDNINLNSQILRFRNNLTDAYSGVPLLQVDQPVCEQVVEQPDLSPPEFSSLPNDIRLVASNGVSLPVGDVLVQRFLDAAVANDDRDVNVAVQVTLADGSALPSVFELGVTSVQFNVVDSAGNQADSVIRTIEVGAVGPPVGFADSASTDEDQAVDIDVLINDAGQDNVLDPQSVVIVSSPRFGTTNINAGVVTYTPQLNRSGVDSFRYTVADVSGATTDSVDVTITVAPVNDVPVTVPDSYTTLASQSVLARVLSNDTDAEGALDIGSLQIVSPPTNGLAAIDFVTGAIVYSPTPGFAGIDRLTYRVADSEGVLSTDTLVSVRVLPAGTMASSPPTTINDLVSVLEDSDTRIEVLANDTDADGDIDVASVQLLTAPANGIVSAPDASGVFTYTPLENYFGEDRFVYQVADSEGQISSSSVLINVIPANDNPVAVSDSAQVQEDDVVRIAVLANDEDADGLAGASVTVARAPQSGSAVWDTAVSRLVYTPVAGFNGTDSLSYQVQDAGGLLSDPADVTISVTGQNDAPVAVADAFDVSDTSPTQLDVLANDSDVDSLLRDADITIIDQPVSGSVAYSGAADRLVYTPGLADTDTFSYQISDSDGALSNIVMVGINVLSSQVAPVAIDDAVAADEQVPLLISVASNDTDADGDLDATSVALVTPPQFGSATVESDGRVTYLSNDNFSGQDSFEYTVADVRGARSNVAQVTVSVSDVNEAPVANSDTATSAEDDSVVIDLLANDTDPESNIATDSVSVVLQASNGAVVVDGSTGQATYTPNAEYFGTDMFSYQVSDTEGLVSNTANVAVTVTSVDDAPVALNDTATSVEDASVIIDVLANDTDPESNIDVATTAIVTQPQNGTVSIDLANGQALYTPDSDFFGSDSFTYTVSDATGLASNSASVTLAVTGVEDAPTAVNDVATSAEDDSVTVDLLANDTDPESNIDFSTAAIVASPQNGVVSINVANGQALYTPDADFFGSDSFRYTVSDLAGLTSNEAIVEITVTSVNDAPTAVDDAASTLEDMAVLVPLLGNDTDGDGQLDLGSVVIQSPPSNGSTTIDAVSGSVEYMPDSDYFGTDVFTYQVADNEGGLSNIAQVTITINSVNDAPVANNDAVTTSENISVTFDPAVNDVDPDGAADIAGVQIVTQPVNGVLASGSTPTQLVYTPDSNVNGSDQFSYQLVDGSGELSNVASISVTIAARPSAPVTVNRTSAALNTETRNIRVLLGASDPENDIDESTVSIISDVTQGATQVQIDGTVDYTPNANYVGQDSFTFRVSDATGLNSNVSTVTITVSDPATGPTASDFEAPQVFSGSTPIIDLTGSVTDADGTVDFNTLSIVNESTGTVDVIGSTGRVQFNLPASFVGVATFEYSVMDNDGINSNTAEVSITVWPAEDQDLDGVARDLEISIGTDPDVADSVYVHIDPDASAAMPDGSSWSLAYPSLEAAMADGKIEAVPGNVVYVLMASNSTVTTVNQEWRLTKTANCDNLIFIGSLDPFVVTPRYDDAGAPRTKLEVVMNGERPVTLSGCSNVQLHYLEISGGRGVVEGGGVWLANSEVVLNSTHIFDNTATEAGAGVYVDDSGAPTTLTVELATIRDNILTPAADSNASGGGVHMVNGASLSVTDSIIRNNTAPSAGSVAVTNTAGGGGLYVSDTPLYLSNTTVSANITGQCGGGLFVAGTESIRIEHSSFSGNEAEQLGGGLCMNSTDQNFTMHNNLITSNYSDSGGGVYLVDNDESRITSNTIVLNLAGGNGGGLAFDTDANPVVSYNIVQFNTANGSGDDVSGDPGQLNGLDASYNFLTNFFANFVGTDNSSAPIEFDNGYYQLASSPGVDYGAISSDDPLFALNLRYTDRTGATTDTGILDAGYHYLEPEVGVPNQIQVTAPDGLFADRVNQRFRLEPISNGVPLGPGHRIYVRSSEASVITHLYTYTADTLDPLGTGDSTQLRDLGDGIYEVLLDVPVDLPSFSISIFINSITTASFSVQLN